MDVEPTPGPWQAHSARKTLAAHGQDNDNGQAVRAAIARATGSGQ